MARGKAIKLTAEQFAVLVALASAGPATKTDLAASSYTVDKLTEQGFARRAGTLKSGTVGRPSTIYAITARGKRKLG